MSKWREMYVISSQRVKISNEIHKNSLFQINQNNLFWKITGSQALTSALFLAMVYIIDARTGDLVVCFGTYGLLPAPASLNTVKHFTSCWKVMVFVNHFPGVVLFVIFIRYKFYGLEEFGIGCPRILPHIV